MASFISIPTKYVYTQATTPTDLTEGKLWYNTSNNTLYLSDGSTYTSILSDIDFDFINNQQLQQDLNILINSIAATSTLNDWEDMFVDIFSDADGVSDTIDTGNTTAIFNTNKYYNGSSDLNTDTMDTTQNLTFKRGLKFVASSEIVLVSATTNQPSGTAPTKWYLGTTNGGSEVASGDITANVATINEVLSAGTYYLTSDNNGSSYDTPRNLSPNFPYAGIGYSITENYDGNTTQCQIWNKFTTLGGSDAVIQTNAISITANPTGHQVYTKNSISGSGTITYDISFDNGSTWITDQALNVKNTSVHAGSQMILKINLNGANDIIASDNYGIMTFYN